MTSRASAKNLFDVGPHPPSYSRIMSGDGGAGAGTSGTGSKKNLIVGILVGLGLILIIALVAYWLWPSSAGTPVPPGGPKSATNVAGTWAAYNVQGTQTNYNYKISQTGTNLTIADANMPALSSTGTISGQSIAAPSLKLTGTVSSDGKRIDWSDKTYWLKTA